VSEERRLIHYSNEYITEVRSVEQAPLEKASRVDKPKGLWVSAEGDDDWPSWCRSEDFRLAGLSHPTQVILRPSARILRINGAEDLLKFHEAYSTVPPWAKKITPEMLDNLPYKNLPAPDFRGYAVRWLDLAQEYQGIIIAPYVWSQRLRLSWYYGWDCASGCIWDSNAVADLVPLPIVSVERTDAPLWGALDGDA
jgi:hypothetical protein